MTTKVKMTQVKVFSRSASSYQDALEWTEASVNGYLAKYENHGADVTATTNVQVIPNDLWKYLAIITVTVSK